MKKMKKVMEININELEERIAGAIEKMDYPATVALHNQICKGSVKHIPDTLNFELTEDVENGILYSVEGNVCKPNLIDKNTNIIIPHCCNTLGIMGAGVALALRNKYDGLTDGYRKLCEQHKDDSLGMVHFHHDINFHDGGTDVSVGIANMIGQLGCASLDNPKPIKYSALVSCMTKVVDEALEMGATIHCPKFGSDLAGGNWDFILELVNEIWIENGINVVIYEFKA